MSILIEKDYQRLLAFIGELYEPVTAEDFGRHLVRLISELVPGTTVGFDEINLATGDYRLSHNSAMDPKALAGYFQRLTEVYQQNPIYDYIQGGGREAAVKISDLRPQREIRRTEFYQDVFKPIGLEYQIAVQVSAPGRVISLSVNRDRDFSDAVTVLLGYAADHISKAYRIANRPMYDLAHWQGGVAGLTDREADVLRWVAQGKSNPEIGVILGITPRTAEKHIENILRKTRTENRAAAVQAFAQASREAAQSVRLDGVHCIERS